MAVRVLRWTAAVIVLLVLVAAGFYYYAANGLPFGVNVPIAGANLVEPDVINVWLGCGHDHTATAIEDTTNITLHARMRPRPGDCGGAAWVELEQPLGERRVIDGYDGKEISVEGGLSDG